MSHHSAARRLRLMVVMSLGALVLALAGCGTSSSSGPGSQAPDDGKTVVMSSRTFGVAEITVAVGDVTFVNEDGVPHHVAEGENGAEAANGRITATRIEGGASAAVSFDEPGDYQITCLIHGSMNMVVHVE
ncbi:MAG: plastocyanin/azurin family copper-binding protein [Chloroflexota bacterium]|nr:plastocyanin/azurin family copper-binding protein [Chloroflexota bacterium]